MSQGVGAAANTGAALIGDQIKNDQTVQMQKQLEQQAADIRVDTATRLAAADQMMKNAALQRYSQIVKQKADEPVPQEGAPVQQTGLTRDSADEAGLKMGGFAGSMDKINGILATAQATLNNPGATPQQKADAQALIAQIGKQVDAQKEVNDDAVDGKTRPRTTEEAVDAANNYALMNDPEAYVAGTTAYNNANRDDMAQKRLDQQAKLAREAGDRQERMANMREDARYRDIMAKLDASQGGAGAKSPANVQLIEYLMAHGMKFDDARDAALGNGEGMRADPKKLAATLAASGTIRVTKDDPPGTTVFSKALAMVTADPMQASTAPSPGTGGASAPAGKSMGNDPLGLRPFIGK
jgi:hypothetical protein